MCLFCFSFSTSFLFCLEVCNDLQPSAWSPSPDTGLPHYNEDVTDPDTKPAGRWNLVPSHVSVPPEPTSTPQTPPHLTTNSFLSQSPIILHEAFFYSTLLSQVVETVQH